jgi:hypothetical protein
MRFTGRSRSNSRSSGLAIWLRTGKDTMNLGALVYTYNISGRHLHHPYAKGGLTDITASENGCDSYMLRMEI